MTALQGADALVICTEWNQFRVVSFARLRDALGARVIVDGRNLYEPEDMARHDLLYFRVGRGLTLYLPPDAAGESAMRAA